MFTVYNIYITQAFGEKKRRVGQNCTLFHFKYSCLLNVNGSDLFVEKESICINAENELRRTFCFCTARQYN